MSDQQQQQLQPQPPALRRTASTTPTAATPTAPTTMSWQPSIYQHYAASYPHLAYTHAHTDYAAAAAGYHHAAHAHAAAAWYGYSFQHALSAPTSVRPGVTSAAGILQHVIAAHPPPPPTAGVQTMPVTPGATATTTAIAGRPMQHVIQAHPHPLPPSATATAATSMQFTTGTTAGLGMGTAAGRGGRKQSQLKGLFAKELPKLMYGFGDDKQVALDSVAVMEEILIEYIVDVCQTALGHTRKTRLQIEDLRRALSRHGDAKKLARMEELLFMQEDIKRARKQFEENEVGTAAGTSARDYQRAV